MDWIQNKKKRKRFTQNMQEEKFGSKSQPHLVMLVEEGSRINVVKEVKEILELAPVSKVIQAYLGLDFVLHPISNGKGTQYENLARLTFDKHDHSLRIFAGIKEDFPPMSAGYPFNEELLKIADLAFKIECSNRIILQRCGFSFRLLYGGWDYNDLRDFMEVDYLTNARSMKYYIGKKQPRNFFCIHHSLHELFASNVTRENQMHFSDLDHIEAVLQMEILGKHRTFLVYQHDRIQKQGLYIEVFDIENGSPHYTFNFTPKLEGSWFVEGVSYFLYGVKETLHLYCVFLVVDPTLPTFQVLRTKYKNYDFNFNSEQPKEMITLPQTRICVAHLQMPVH
jgi:hypothetical protein